MGRTLLRHLVRRIAFAAVLVLLVSSSSLVLARLVPGDITTDLLAAGASAETIARERSRLGLDRPAAVQYLDWLRRAARLDLGQSYRYRRPVRDLIAERAGNTVMLGVTALAVATLLGLPLGVMAGSHPGWIASAVRVGSVAALSVPPLITSLALAFLAARTGWFPVGGLPPPTASGWLGDLPRLAWHLALPALALGLPFAAVIERLQSQAIARALESPHILAAHARGLPPSRIVWRHALRDSIRPVIAVYGIIIGTLLSGSFAVEVVTAWPGLGLLMRDALSSRDVYLVAGCAATGALFLAAGTLIADLMLVAVDPRLREDTP